MTAFVVMIENTFEAVDENDAVRQMARWLDDYAYVAWYRVWSATAYPGIDIHTGTFIDAEDLSI